MSSVWTIPPSIEENRRNRLQRDEFGREQRYQRGIESEQQELVQQREHQRPDTVWTMAANSTPVQPVAPEFNPLRTAHVVERQRREAQSRAPYEADQTAEAALHATAHPSILGAPFDRSVSLFRLHTPLDQSVRSTGSTVPATGDRFVNRASRARNETEDESTTTHGHQQTHTREEDEISESDIEEEDELDAVTPAKFAPPLTSHSDPTANITPQVTHKLTTQYQTNDSPMPPPSPSHRELQEINRQLKEIERELYGDDPQKEERPGIVSEDSSNQTSSYAERHRQRFLSPKAAGASHTPQLVSPHSPNAAATTSPAFLSTTDRAIIERYKLEMLEGEWERQKVMEELDQVNAELRQQDQQQQQSQPQQDSLTSAVHPQSLLDDSHPSTIGEESDSVTGALDRTTDSNLTESTKRPLDQAQNQEPTLSHEVEEQKHESTAASVDPLPSPTQLPPLPSPAPSTSLSDLLRISDLAYPDLSPGGLKRLSGIVSPWHAPLLPKPKESNDVPMPAVLSGPRPWEIPRSTGEPTAIGRVHDALATDLDPSISSRLAFDPASRLLENLWAAEAEFEKMLGESLPLKYARLEEEKQSSEMQRPGNFIHPQDYIPIVTVKTPPRTTRKADRPRSTPHSRKNTKSDVPNDQPIVLESIGASDTQHQFLAVTDWDGGLELANADSIPTRDFNAPSPSGRRNVLVGVNDYVLPDHVMELLDEDISGVLPVHHPASGFGHLVPLDAHSQAIAKMHQRNEKEHALFEEGDPAVMEQFPFGDGPTSSNGKSKSTPGRRASIKKSGKVQPTPRSIYELAAARQKEHTRILSMQDSPTKGFAGRSPSPLRHSHLHRAPDPFAMVQYIERRKVHEAMAELDNDLLELEQRALALSAEHQADHRALEEYQQRLAQRKQTLLSSQLTHAQHHWMNQQQATNAARSTLEQIEDILNKPERRMAREEVAVEMREYASPKAASNVQRPPVQHSPRPSASSVVSVDRTSTFVQQVNESASASVARPSAAVASTPITIPSLSSRPSTDSSSLASSKLTLLKKKRMIKKPPQSKIEHDLDSALSAAQHLINNFMDKMK